MNRLPHTPSSPPRAASLLPRLTIALVAIALVAASASAALARPGGRGGPGADKAQLEAKVKEFRARMLREHVGLDEGRAVRAEAILDANEVTRKALRKAAKKARRTLRDLHEDGSEDDAAYAKAVDDMVKARRGLSELREAEFDSLRDFLSGREQARLLHAMHKAKRHMKRMARERRKGGEPGVRGGRGGRGGHGHRGGPPQGGPDDFDGVDDTF